MLDYSIMKPEGILVLKPNAPLRKEDFDGLGAAVDAYLSDHAGLRGVLIRAKEFPGWENFGGFTAHMRFVRDHHKQIERVAIVTDSPLGGIAEVLGKLFLSAEVLYFRFSYSSKSLTWLESARVPERII